MDRRWTAGRYTPLNTMLHRLDPRVKLAVGLVFAAVLFSVQTATGFLLLSAYVVLGILVSRTSAHDVLRALQPLLLLVTLTALFHMLFVPGTPIVSVGPVYVSDEGLATALLFAIRVVLLLAGLHVLTVTTKPVAMTDAVEWFLRPTQRVGLPAGEIALMMTIALTFIPTLYDELDTVMKAQAARGASFATGGPVQRMRSFIPVIIPLLAGTLRRADELGVAMEARGYRGAEGRTRWRALPHTRTDQLVGVVSVLSILWIGWNY